MATKVVMPQLGESVTEGTITRWLKQVGDSISKYEPLCEVETDKVTAEVPATVSGKLLEIIVDEGTTVEVGQLICYIQEEGQGTAETTTDQTIENNTKDEASTEEFKAEQYNKTSDTIDKVDNRNKTRYSPAVLRLAQENNLDLSQIVGSGLEGRITRKDVLNYIEEGPTKTNTVKQEEVNQQQIKHEPEQQSKSISNQTMPLNQEKASEGTKLENGDKEIIVNNVRKTIAKRMVQSKHEAPHAWLTVEADVTDLVNYRNKLKNDFKKEENFSITYLPFFIKAVVEAIKEHPIVNSIWAEDKIIIKKRINISIAVATDDALYVPVIQDADQKSIYGIAKAINELVMKTKAGKLSLNEMQGGTFTVNNTGSFGSVLSAPIINAPQAGIITMESIIKKPVVHQDMIAVRSMVNLCMSLDHRILDGLVAGRFMQSVKRKLEEMGNKEISIY